VLLFITTTTTAPSASHVRRLNAHTHVRRSMPLSLSPPLAASPPEPAAPVRQWWERVRIEPDVLPPFHAEPQRPAEPPAAAAAVVPTPAAPATPATPQHIAGSPTHTRPVLHLDTSSDSASPVSPFFPPSSSDGEPRTPAAPEAAEPQTQQRSPAADFLSAFASLHSVIDGDAPGHAHTADEAWGTRSETRARSLSPLFAATMAASGDAGSSSMTYGASAPESGSPSAPFGLGSAAASLFAGAASGSARLPSSMPPQHAAALRRTLAPDDEGATLADGRYVLGRAVGYGGSSVVREGWAQTPATELDLPASSTRVAIKIVRLDTVDDTVAAEVALWQALPPHAHLLPLLHHEEMPLAPGSDVRVLFLVMPFADAGSLLDYVRNEGVPKRLLAAAGSSGGLSRASSMHTQLSNGGTAGGRTDYSARVAAAAAPLAGRTGSGFLPRSSAARAQSGAPISGHGRIFSDGGLPSSAAGSGGSAAGSAPYRRGTLGTAEAGSASNAGSLSATGAAGLLRRASSRAAPPRSRGLPLGNARRVLAQLASALEALQAEGVRHGDLKLENVLGQTKEVVGDADVQPEVTMWRLADFGLARKIDEQQRAPLYQAPAPPAAEEKGRKSRPAGRASDIGPAARGMSSFPTLPRGGSLAYAAPETLRDADEASTADRADAPEGSLSPAAALVHAQDMWALGCIFYALLSGRLPFADSFEPRLQAKIARGIWTLPPRLVRRRPRRSAPGSEGDGLPAASSAMSPSGSAQSFSERSRPDSWASFSGNFGGRELSSSVSSLPPKGTLLQEEDNASDTEDEGDEEARLWDGDRVERQEARDVLRGLLETDPARRWTLADVLASPCLARLHEPPAVEERGRQAQTEPLRFERQASRERVTRLDSELSHSRPSPKIFDGDLPGRSQTGSPFGSSVRSRPSSPFLSSSDAQDSMPPCGRRRAGEMAHLREGHAWHAHSDTSRSATHTPQSGARPIDIVSTRSASGSRSRSRSRQACEREAAGYSVASLRHHEAAQSPEQMRGRKPLLHRSSSYESSSTGLPGGNKSSAHAERGSSSRGSRSGARSTSRPRMLTGVPSSAGATTGGSGSSGWAAEFVFPPANGDGFRWRSAERSSSSRTNAARSSTSRSRSRAPEALANLLARERAQQHHMQHGDAGSSVPSSPAPGTPGSGTEDSSRSRERGARNASSGLRARASTDALPSPRPGSALPRGIQREPQAEADEDEPETQWWQRGRGREPKPAPPAHSPEQARAVLPPVSAASTPPASDEARRAVPRWPWAS
jgi:serine/threonine protein kinase